MSQSVVTIRLNGTPYQIGCGTGEEARIEELAAEIEIVVQQLVGSVLDGDVSVLMLLLVHFGILGENWGVVFLAVMVVLLNVLHPDVLVLVIVVQASLSALFY